MRTQSLAGFTAAVAVVATLALPSAGALAVEGEDVDPGHKVLDAKSASYSDARTVAGQYGWEVEPTLEFLDESRRFAVLTAELAREHPKTYASATFARRPGGTSLVRFVDEPPREALERIEKSGLRIEVLGGAKYSEQELQERAKAVHRHLLESGFKQVVTATTSKDSIVASVYGEGDAQLPPELAEDTEVSRSREPVARDEHTLGGAWLLLNGARMCTSGFTVENNTGVTGVATAGHCTVNQYRQPSNGLTYGMTFQAQHYGFWGDYEWHTTPHIEPAEFYATATQVRQVNSVSGLLPVGTWSCVYGRSSNLRACDRVYSNWVIATFSGPTHFFLMAMENDNTIGGDSGGPWSFATIADGIHKGDLFLGGGRRNVWSRADLLPWALGVNVRTQ